jgi:hypothetical protein
MARVTDVTPYGMGVISMHPVAIGEPVVVKVRPPRSEQEVSLPAESVYCGPTVSTHGFSETKIGLKFLGPAEPRRKELAGMLLVLRNVTGASRPSYERLRLGDR